MWPQLMACLNRQQFCGAAATCSFVEQTKLHLGVKKEVLRALGQGQVCGGGE